jgi:hypothetical protein
VNTRQRRALGCAPTDRITADRQAMLSLPPVAPATGWRSATRLARDHYVRLDSNDYSVHPDAVGRLVEVRADLRHVTVTLARRAGGPDSGRLLARHERCWAKHQSLTDPEHQQAAAKMRADRQRPRRAAAVEDVERRALRDYDAAFGLTDGEIA